MVGFHVFNPLLWVFTKVMPKLIGPLYRTFGVPGLVALPWVTLTVEKVAYDTLAAARGYDMQAEHAKKQQEQGENMHGGFPSGGAALPNLSLLPITSEENRLILSLLGDAPRQQPAPTTVAA